MDILFTFDAGCFGVCDRAATPPVKKETNTNTDEVVETYTKLLCISEKHSGDAAYKDKENKKYVDVTMTIDHELSRTDKKAVKNNKSGIETMKIFPKLLWTDRKPVDIEASVEAGDTKYVEVTTETDHELLFGNNVDAGNNTNEDEMEKFHHKLWMTDKKHADDAAATVLMPDSFYQHQNGKEMIKSALADHNHFWEDEPGDNGTPRSKIVETIWWVFKTSMLLFLLDLLEMVGWQNALLGKPKREKTEKHVFRPFQQQHKATALDLSEVAPNDESGSNTSEGKYEDLNDGRYEKTIYVKTWTGRTITVVFNPESTTRLMKNEIERRTGIPTDHQQLVAGGRILMDNASLQESGLSDGRTIELTAKLLGGTKHKSLSPKPMETERDKKRKESEPCIDVSSLDKGNAVANHEDEPIETRKWMRETMKDLRQRTDDVSDLERSVSSMQWDMTEVKNTLKSFTEARTTRDKKLDEMLASLTTRFIEKEKKTEEDISNMEKRLGNQITSLDQRISLIKRGSGGAGHIQTGVTQGGWGPTPTDLKAVIHGFKQEAKEQEVKRIVARIISETGMKEKHWIDYPAIPLNHVFVEFEDKRIRDRFVRSASMRKYEMEERTIKISEALEPEQRFEKKRLGYIKYAINKAQGYIYTG